MCELLSGENKIPKDEREASKSNWKNYVYTLVLNRLIDLSKKKVKIFKNEQVLKKPIDEEEENYVFDGESVYLGFTRLEKKILLAHFSPSQEYLYFFRSIPEPAHLKGFSYAIREFYKIPPESFKRAVYNIYAKSSRLNMLYGADMNANPECFGKLYDDLVGVCKEHCSLRKECRFRIMQKLESARMSDKITETTRQNWRNFMTTPHLDLNKFCNLNSYDQLTQEIISNFYDFGFVPYPGKAYISFRIGEKRIFSLVRTRVKDGLGSCILGIAVKKREFYPPALRDHVTDTAEGGFPYLTFESIEDLREFLSQFVRSFLVLQGDLQNDGSSEFVSENVESAG